jgi:hypothetical protein
MRQIFALTALVLMSTAAFAAGPTPEGTWVDKYGTSFRMKMCGDGTQLCATLTDIQGKSRTEENLALVNRQVIKAQQIAPNKWQGTLTMNGSQAKGTVTQVNSRTIEIQGCQLLCSTLTFTKV